MTTREIVKEYLEKNGYDGLYSSYCSCALNDLMPCDDEVCAGCEAGYFVKIEACKKCTDYNFCISQEKDSTECPWSCDADRVWMGLKKGEKKCTK